MRNGSLVTFQRLSQDVAEFRRCCVEISNQAREFANLDWLSPAAVGSRLFGRWTSGAPIVKSPQRDDPLLGANDNENDSFDFASDAAKGDSACPFFAHIRKMNPRRQGSGRSQRNRLLRRGIAFGPPFPVDGERGLLFLSYQASIERQFEFLVQRWASASDFPSQGAGVDPILAERRVIELSINDEAGTRHRFRAKLQRQLVSITGGEHFFSPSISALQLLVS
jgi:Dyp-type peroxidase family